MDGFYLSARETATRLGVKLDTLYAYVSRGLLHSVAVAGHRERQYDAEEVDRFRASRGSARYGEPRATVIPVIDSAIGTIEGERHYYRGQDALALAMTASLEDIAALLWNIAPSALVPLSHGVRQPGCAGGLIERCHIALAEAAASDFAALDLSRPGLVRTGRSILALLTACVTQHAVCEHSVHDQLSVAWGLDASGSDVVRRCLVLLADHELNASTFVARCIASTGATPYAVVTGALAALSGRRHGGVSARAEAMFRELAEAPDPVPVMAARLARDETLPGMGQPLYPHGDPRAHAIVTALAAAVPKRAQWIDGIVEGATRLGGQRPNVDFALGLTATVLGLPQGAAFAIFLVARSVGWIAHAIEQYDSTVLIRPRARYTGPAPISAEP
ncbi:MAG: citrate synthase family protein [Alphaproteobacteria bacterium]|nr:citrate synthase family protein [Alphaproteobacteria bacterium]